MTVVLDAGGVSALAGDRQHLRQIERRAGWPPVVPSVVLAEALTGDPRRDHAANRLLRACQLVEIDEALAREAARLRTATRRAAKISAVDAIVAAVASEVPNPVVLTSDSDDLRALAQHARRPIEIRRA